MTVEWNQIRALYQQAFDLAPEAQRTYLETECKGDPALLREMLSLLESSADGDGFLEPPSLGAIEDLVGPKIQLESGTRIGSFRLERVIASGGMGVVFEANQISPRRKVALKVMRLGLAGKNSVRRFKLKAEILAGLRHPSSAAIFETGVYLESHGRPTRILRSQVSRPRPVPSSGRWPP